MSDPVTWIEKYFRIPETLKHPDPKLRGRLVLAPYQRDLLREAYSKDENGNFKYSIVVWADIKKSIKSTIAAASTLYFSNLVDYGEFYVVANDLKQADSRVAHYARRAIELNPDLQKSFKVNRHRISNTNGSYIEAIPIDPAGEAGSNANKIVVSEMWGANETAKQRMWSEMTIPPNKHGQGFRWVESYAGFTEESELLYSLYETGTKEGELLWPDRLYEVTEGVPTVLEAYVNKSARMLCLWNTQPRMPWQSKEYYASERAILMPNEFLRMHRNTWVTSAENFVPVEWWDSCKHDGDDWPKIDISRESMVISMDAAVSGDSFAMWMGCRHPVNRDEICVIHAQTWVPTGNGQKLDFIGTEDDPGPEIVLKRLISRYNVVKVTYDEYQLHSMCTRLYREGLAWFDPFSQGALRLVADTQLRDVIRDRRIWHRGEPELRQHIINSDAKIDAEDHKMRIVKRTQKLKVDLNVAQSMGVHELLRLNL